MPSIGSSAFVRRKNYVNTLPLDAPELTQGDTSITGATTILYFQLPKSGAQSWFAQAKVVKGTGSPTIEIGTLTPDGSAFVALNTTPHPNSIATAGADGWIAAYIGQQGLAWPCVRWDPKDTDAELVQLWAGPVG